MSKPTALFIDGENMPASFAPQILKIAAGAFVRRAYGDVTRIKSWSDTPSIRLVHSGTGKNAGDVLLALDALELAYEGLAERFVIASSDGDFTHLATRLREKGLEVIGAVASKPQLQASPSACDLTLDQKIRQVIAQHSKEGRGMKIADLSLAMKHTHGVLISKLPEKRWRPYLAGRPHLYEIDPKGPEAFVRYRPEGFAQMVVAAR